MSKRLGGRSAQLGFSFQNRVAAWVAVQILAEQSASPPFDLPPAVSVEFMRCETDEAVGDLSVGTSEDGRLLIEVKHRVQVSEREDSAIASALANLVREFCLARVQLSTDRSQRSLDPERDRLVLVVGPGSSQAAREALRHVLSRLRNLTPDQELRDAASNLAEHRTLNVFQGHVRRSWERVERRRPSDSDVREFSSCFQILTLDVEEGGQHEEQAKELLRTAVLGDATQAGAAWSILVEACAGFGSQGLGATRSVLQGLLIQRGIHLRTPESFRHDTQRLLDVSGRAVMRLHDFSVIRVGDSQLKIDRAAVDVLRAAAEESSVLVVGEPGAGKSAVLHELAMRLDNEGRDVLVFSADTLAAESLGTLRSEIGLAHELVGTLANWQGVGPAFLIIDALDAARSPHAVKTFRDLIAAVGREAQRWRVIASIRKYDLQHSHDLRRLFAGSPPSDLQDPMFRDTRHVSVPRLTDDELRQAMAKSRQLERVFATAEEPLAGMLRLPFNLQLAGDLIGEGMELGAFASLRTQVELLDRYWERRIIRDDRQGGAREALLRRALEEMVRMQALRAERTRIAGDANASAVLEDLLSCHILSEWESPWSGAQDRYVLVFAHHTLFDYAASRLVLPRDAQELVGLLKDRPELVLLIRPSLDLHFRHCWLSDPVHSRFWDLVFSLAAADGVPAIASTAGPGVAAEWASGGQDLDPLLSALASSNARTRDTALKAFEYLVRAIVALSSEPTYSLVGDQAGPWCEMLQRASYDLEQPLAYAVCSLLNHICEHTECFTSQQRSDAGTAARRVFEFASGLPVRDGWLATHALQAVCRTFESEPVASAALIRYSIEPEHIRDHGFEELGRLEGEISRLVSLDPLLVEDIYKAAFSHHEARETPTPLGSSRILPLSSTPRQDYDLALLSLADAYADFFRHAPAHATRGLIVALSAYVSEEHPPASGEVHEESFVFSGATAWVRTDYSFIWGAGDSHRNGGILRMLDAFEQQLAALAGDADRAGQSYQVVETVAALNRPAALWRRVLICGARAPENLGRHIRELAWALPILTCCDTTVAAGDFLSAIFCRLDSEERERVERAILSIVDCADASGSDSRLTLRNRLLGCLTAESVVTEEARQLLAELTAACGIPPKEPPFRMEFAEGGPHTEEDHLADQGVAVDEQCNRRIPALEKPIRDFVDGHHDCVPTAEEIEALMPAISQLHAALSTAVQDSVDPMQSGHAWDCLVEACEQVARAEGIDCRSAVGALLRRFLLEGARHPDPPYRPKDDVSFDELPRWDRPAARVVAAGGLMTLAQRTGCHDAAILGAIEQLSADRVPAVRFQVAWRLLCLYRTAPQLMWSILERLCHEEPREGVLLALASEPLPRLATADPEGISALARALYERAPRGPVTACCAALFLGLYLWHDDSSCRDLLLCICEHPAEFHDEAQRMVAELRYHLTCGPVHPADPKQDRVRQYALLLMRRLLVGIRQGLDELGETMQGVTTEAWPEAQRERGRSLVQLADQVCMEVYLASGALDDKRAEQGETERPSDQASSIRFLREAAPLLDDLAQFSYPHLVHRLLQTLERLIPYDPAGVFQRIAQVVRSGKAGGYQYEALAADLIVRLVEVYLADYRFVFRESHDCQRDVLEILDTFVVAGWPRAQHLVYRLQAIFQ